MCCFSREVEQVSLTQIFAHPGKDERQFLVYSMRYISKVEMAMILPIPVPKGTKEDALTFINLEKYDQFFAEMDEGFPKQRSKGGPRSIDAKKDDAPKLKVVDVGSFVASFVPTIKDFERLDEQFRLPSGTWDKLPGYKDFGFAVFKLKKGDLKVHPMAFDFPRANKRELFFPTVHIHDGKVHEFAEFDHTLYCQGANAAEVKWEESEQPAEMFMPNLKLAQGIVDANGHVYRTKMHGKLKNQDTVLV